MIYKTIFTIAVFLITLLNLSREANGCCFTMPPKVVKVSKWAFSIPNIESTYYIHESHPCPSGYKLESQHSHIATSISNNPSIYGYSVCCEEKIIYIDKKNETLNY